MKRLYIRREIAQFTPCEAQSVGLKIDHKRTLQVSTRFIALYFRQKRAEQRAPGTTMLSEDALVMFPEDSMTVNSP